VNRSGETTCHDLECGLVTRGIYRRWDSKMYAGRAEEVTDKSTSNDTAEARLTTVPFVLVESVASTFP
jgi:hypothetical protein